MNNVEIADRFAEMWKRSRMDAGRSQEYVAKALGVSKKTVQNWEDGTSCPNQMMGFKWFDVLGLQPLPYYLEMLYPDQFMGLNPSSEDEDIKDALITYINGTTPKQRRKMLYLLNGKHGSSPSAVIEMMTAHLHTPLRDRLNVAQSIITNYEIAEAHGLIRGKDYIKPDMDLLRKGLKDGTAAVIRHEQSYTSAKED